MQALLIWCELPHRTTFHKIPLENRWMRLHGKFVGDEETSSTEADEIMHLAEIRGPELDSQMLDSDVVGFVQSGFWEEE